MKPAKCHSCGAGCWRGETERGKVVLVNSWTSDSGKVVAIDPDADVPMVRWVKKDEQLPAGTRRYLLHMVTCRKKRR